MPSVHEGKHILYQIIQPGIKYTCPPNSKPAHMNTKNKIHSPRSQSSTTICTEFSFTYNFFSTMRTNLCIIKNKVHLFSEHHLHLSDILCTSPPSLAEVKHTRESYSNHNAQWPKAYIHFLKYGCMPT